jgi:hypothetical protein
VRLELPKPFWEPAIELVPEGLWLSLPVIRLPLGEVVLSQGPIELGDVERYVRGELDIERPGYAVRHAHTIYAQDGHHRWLARRDLGLKAMRWHVLDNEVWQKAFAEALTAAVRSYNSGAESSVR